MNLQEEWDNMSSELMLKADHKEAPGNHQIKAESGNVLHHIKKTLTIKMRWARGISLAAFLGFILTGVQVRYWLLGMFVVYEAGRYLMIHKMKSLKDEVDVNQETKEVLRSQLNLVKQALKIERVWGYLFIPLSGPFGLVVSYLLQGKTFHSILAQPNMIYILMGLVLLGVPLILLAEKMNKIAFGSYLNKLQHNISLLDSE